MFGLSDAHAESNRADYNLGLVSFKLSLNFAASFRRNSCMIKVSFNALTFKKCSNGFGIFFVLV